MTAEPRPLFLPVLRLLAQTYQAFELHSARHTRALGLTPAQFDVIATLGNTQGMSCKLLSEKTLITKGTLTGVLDRLQQKKLIARTPQDEDKRSTFISLTEAGHALFAQVFPAHLLYTQQALSQFTSEDFKACSAALAPLRNAFLNALENPQ